MLNGGGSTFQWKSFVYICCDDIEHVDNQTWTLNTWAKNLKVQLQHFAKWTREHKGIYNPFTYAFNIRIKTLTGKEYLADHLIDADVVQVIRSIYTISKADTLRSCQGSEDLKDIFFGPHVVEQEYMERIENSWYDSDMEE